MLKVGIIDDDKTYIELLLKMLEKVDCKPIELNNTEDIAAQVINNDIDILVTDYWMEGLNGQDINKLLKSNSQTKDLPVILLSGSINRKQGIDKGFNQYVHKPVALDTLWEIIQKNYKSNQKSQMLDIYEMDKDFRSTIAEKLVEYNYKVFGYSVFDTMISDIQNGITPDIIILGVKNGIDHPKMMMEKLENLSQFKTIFIIKNKFQNSKLDFLQKNSAMIFSNYDGIESEIGKFLDAYNIGSKKEDTKQIDEKVKLPETNCSTTQMEELKQSIKLLEQKFALKSIEDIIDLSEDLTQLCESEEVTSLARISDSIHGLAEIDNKITGSLYELLMELKSEFNSISA